MISVVILTYNEETNIARCLDSVSWSDDILVVDSFSEDRTVEISKRHGARVIQRAFEDFSSQRNFASEQGNLKHEWVLHLDADEVVSPELRAELARAMFGDKDAYRVSSKLINFCGMPGFSRGIKFVSGESKPCASNRSVTVSEKRWSQAVSAH